MSASEVVCSVIVALIGASVITFLIADGVQFFRAIRLARKKNRLDEWFQQENRFSPGSGFKLFRKYSR